MSYVLVYICNICGFQAIFKYMDIVLYMDLNKKMLSLMTHAGYKGGDIAHAGCVMFFLQNSRYLFIVLLTLITIIKLIVKK